MTRRSKLPSVLSSAQKRSLERSAKEHVIEIERDSLSDEQISDYGFDVDAVMEACGAASEISREISETATGFYVKALVKALGREIQWS
jgi:hypothetical protein